MIGVSVGLGFILALVCSAMVLYCISKYKLPNQSLAGDFAQLKESVDQLKSEKSVPSQKSSIASNLDDLERLIEWRNQGRISTEEYEEYRSKLFN